MSRVSIELETMITVGLLVLLSVLTELLMALRLCLGATGKSKTNPLLKVEINVAKSQVKPIVDQLRVCLGWEEPLVNVFKVCNSEFAL